MPSNTLDKKPIGTILERTDDAISRESVAIRDIVASLGSSSFLSIQFLFAIAVTSPLSGIPFFSTFCGTIIALIAFQSLLGHTHIWVPDVIARRQISAERVKGALKWMERPASWLDRHRSANLLFVTSRPFVYLPRALCMICGALMPILEIVPFSSSILGAVVSMMTFGMLTRNGLVILLAFCILISSGAAALQLFFN